MLKSLYLFSLGILKYGWLFFVLVFLDIADVFEKFIKPHLPDKWQEITMSPVIFWPIVGLGIFWAAFMTYHELRSKSANYEPGIDGRLRELHKNGALLNKNDFKSHESWFNEVRDYVSNTLPELVHIIDTDNSLQGIDPSNMRMVRMGSLRKVISKYQKRQYGK